MRFPSSPPDGAKTSTIVYRVPFYDTDAMRIVHHARYVHYFELSRIAFLDEHDRPYREYVAEGLHYAVTRCELAYQMPARFDDRLTIRARCGDVRGARFRFDYSVEREGAQVADGWTTHACVSVGDHRPTRVPAWLAQAIAEAEA
jgi:acyl-CoA thioester hydrolase